MWVSCSPFRPELGGVDQRPQNVLERRAAHFRDDFPQTDPARVRTVTYDQNGVGERGIEVDPGEAAWISARQEARKVARKVGTQSGEREYVE